MKSIDSYYYNSQYNIEIQFEHVNHFRMYNVKRLHLL